MGTVCFRAKMERTINSVISNNLEIPALWWYVVASLHVSTGIFQWDNAEQSHTDIAKAMTEEGERWLQGSLQYSVANLNDKCDRNGIALSHNLRRSCRKKKNTWKPSSLVILRIRIYLCVVRRNGNITKRCHNNAFSIPSKLFSDLMIYFKVFISWPTRVCSILDLGINLAIYTMLWSGAISFLSPQHISSTS